MAQPGCARRAARPGSSQTVQGGRNAVRGRGSAVTRAGSRGGQARKVPRPLPATVWVLGVVSLMMDVASEMIHSLLPLFLVGPLGVGVSAVGVIEGVSESSALLVKLGAGAWSDRLSRRKGLVVLGYGLAAMSKPAFALAHGAGAVFAARWVDRVGKGLRDAPRDALVADLVPSARRGAAFGLRQALDTGGAVLGPLLAAALMASNGGDFRAVFWLAAVPAAMSVGCLVVGVQEPPRRREGGPARRPPPGGVNRLGAACWAVVGLGALVALARFSQAFLVLRAQQLGVTAASVPLALVAMNGVYALTAYPFGRLADRGRRTWLLAGGLAALVAADVALAFAPGWSWLGAGVALWGLHLGMTQGLLAAMVADAAPEALRGTAFGLFNLATGVASLAASVLAGVLWDRLGPAVPFIGGAAFAASALLALAPMIRRAS